MLADHPAYTTDPVGAPYVLGRWHRDRVSLVGYRQELHAQVTAALRGQPRRKFLILARARSGTTLLVRLIRQTPAMRCQGEVLHYAVRNPRSHLNNLARATRKPVCGAKLLSYQIVEVQRMRDPLGFFRGLEADGFRFIHLVRDTFEQCVSLSVAQAQSIYYLDAASDRKGPERTRLDPDAFVRQVRWNLALLDLERRIMGEFEHLALEYGRDLSDGALHQQTVDRIATYLDVESGPVSTPSRKAIRESYDSMLSNYGEIVAALRAADLGHILPAY